MDADNIGRRDRHYCEMSSWSAPSSLYTQQEQATSGSTVGRELLSLSRFGNTESFYRNMVVGHGPYWGGVRGYGGGMDGGGDNK